MYIEQFGGIRAISSAESLASAAVIARFLAMKQISVKQIAFVISTATVSTGNIVVTVKRRPTVGSTSGEVTIGTLTIPTAIAAGKMYYKNVTPVVVAQGEEVVFEVTTAAAGMGAAGAGYSSLGVEHDPEQPANNSDMVASA